MPNVTISVPDQLKAEMDTLSEVNWSEICRKAISRYIEQRENPTPRIEIDIRDCMLVDTPSFPTGFPTLIVNLRVHNKMDSEIIVDRILSNSWFTKPIREGTTYAIGSVWNLKKTTIPSNSSGDSEIHFPLLKSKVSKLSNQFTHTFVCRVRCTVYVEGFSNEYQQEVKTKIPIDHWKGFMQSVLYEASNKADQ